ncbi:MAG: response regulator transcription factor [Clostridia bacterium]|nr:response regulator transcription factor [Clostridia bacterium]
MYNVLVCDDDVAILDSVEIYLQNEGYGTFRAVNGKQALEIVEHNEVHCIILDIMMPEMDGIATVLNLRKESNIPVILLSAKSEDTDKIAGLSFGADDYVTKPFNPLELMARVKSQIRRFVNLGGLDENDSSGENVFVTGGLMIDCDAHICTVDGEGVNLTATEFGILEYLMKNMGKVIPAEKIYESVWNEPAIVSDKTVTVHIRRIREKIEINPKDPKYLKVVWGIGYKIEKI